MLTKQQQKDDWIRCSGFHYSDEDRWLRDNVAKLFDIEEPDEQQKKVIWMANLHITLLDLPGGAYPNHKKELLALAHKHFDPPKEF